MMYNYKVYVHKRDTEYSMNDKVYSNVLCTQWEIAQYVKILNDSDVLGLHYYFERV